MIHRVIFGEIHRMISAVTLRVNQSESSNLGSMTNQIRAFSENHSYIATIIPITTLKKNLKYLKILNI